MAVSARDPDKLESPSGSLDDPVNPSRYSINYGGYNPNEDSEIPNLLSLPSEVLVKIMSFLSEARDKLNLRYVSQRLRSISETPSLWREFVWSDCNRCEEKHLCNILKVYGTHIRRLSFPHHLAQLVTRVNNSWGRPRTTLAIVNASEMMKMLQCCNSLTHLKLAPLDYANSRFDEHLTMTRGIKEMKHLQVLNVHCYRSLQTYLNLGVKLEELTIHIKSLFRTDINTFENWMLNGFIPPNLNIIVLDQELVDLRDFLLDAWPRWNSQIPAGRIACLKLYIGYTAPLNLFQNAPVFQLQYGQPITLPFVQASNIGVTDKWLLLTDHDDGSKTVYKGKLCITLPHDMYCIIHDHGLDNQLQQDCHVSNLTELDLSECNLEFTLSLVACPQLQRLNLWKNRSLRLEDLQAIATYCCNLQGLNLVRMLISDSKFYMKVWEILSTMQLTHLAMDDSFFDTNQFITDGMNKKHLATLFKQFTTLQALELYSSSRYPTMRIDYELLAHFSSLEYCRLNDSKQSTCAQDIFAACKKLKYFCCYCLGRLRLSQLSVHNNLQQLCISSWGTDINDNFMDMVSTHGGLIHVALFVNSVSRKGITTLIRNSPNLLSFRFNKQEIYLMNYFESLYASLCKEFAHRKLFTSGLFCLLDDDNLLQNTDLMSLWPPEQSLDLQTR